MLSYMERLTHIELVFFFFSVHESLLFTSECVFDSYTNSQGLKIHFYSLPQQGTLNFKQLRFPILYLHI